MNSDDKQEESEMVPRSELEAAASRVKDLELDNLILEQTEAARREIEQQEIDRKTEVAWTVATAEVEGSAYGAKLPALTRELGSSIAFVARLSGATLEDNPDQQIENLTIEAAIDALELLDSEE